MESRSTVMKTLQQKPGDRIKAAIAAVALQGLLVYALVTGLAVHMPGVADGRLALFSVLPKPPPPEKPVPRPVKSAKAEGAAAPPNLRSRATEAVAPPAIVPPITPPPIVVAPTAGTGADPSAGASDRPGPGSGAGGQGNGTGSGGAGDGDGDGGTDIPPRQIKGRIKNSDYPRAARDALIQGTVAVRYTVTTDGRATDCRVTGSSGNAELDATTCRLIEQRFRFKPSRDEDGTPVEAIIVENHSWMVRDTTGEQGTEDR